VAGLLDLTDPQSAPICSPYSLSSQPTAEVATDGTVFDSPEESFLYFFPSSDENYVVMIPLLDGSSSDPFFLSGIVITVSVVMTQASHNHQYIRKPPGLNASPPVFSTKL